MDWRANLIGALAFLVLAAVAPALPPWLISLATIAFLAVWCVTSPSMLISASLPSVACVTIEASRESMPRGKDILDSRITIPQLL